LNKEILSCSLLFSDVAGLKQLFAQDKLQFHGSQQYLAAPVCFHSFLRQLFRQDWVVYAKPPFGGAEHVLNYLARYTIASPSPTIGSSPSRTIASPSAGEIMPTAARRRS
jgi:hypothetical protein